MEFSGIGVGFESCNYCYGPIEPIMQPAIYLLPETHHLKGFYAVFE
jgi:hypothetical protein